MARFRSGELDRLYECILQLETPEECYDFFDDLCTVQELKDLSQRLEIAFQLRSGKNFKEIAQKTGVSTTTISRVKRCLEYGSGGYLNAIEKCEKEAEA